MIKVNDYKTVEKVIFLMHYHKDWKVRKKNWKRYKTTKKRYFGHSVEKIIKRQTGGQKQRVGVSATN